MSGKHSTKRPTVSKTNGHKSHTQYFGPSGSHHENTWDTLPTTQQPGRTHCCLLILLRLITSSCRWTHYSQDLIARRAIALQKHMEDLTALHDHILTARNHAAIHFKHKHSTTIRDFDFKPRALVLI